MALYRSLSLKVQAAINSIFVNSGLHGYLYVNRLICSDEPTDNYHPTVQPSQHYNAF